MRTLLCLAALLTALTFASSAYASRLAYDADGTLAYVAEPDEVNDGLVGTSPYATTCGAVGTPCIHITDWGAYIDLSSVPAGCAAGNQTEGWPRWGEAVCPVPPRLRVDLGDANDNWTDWDGPSAIDAGPGNDNTIAGAGGDDAIRGGPGNDVLLGGTGDDALDGGLGDDAFEGIVGERLFGGDPPSQGSDTYTGGGGGDSVIYTGRGEDLALSLDGVANDGEPGEHDNVGGDVTTVLGGDGADVITGNGHANAFAGDSGDDVIAGAGGDDRLFGGSGSDRLDAGAGQDFLEGDDAGDVLVGGPDVDTFYGEDPLNSSSGTTGRDQILARDGNAEFVACGPGIDAAQVDGTDQVRNWVATDDQCETVDASGAGGPVAGRGLSVSSVVMRGGRIKVALVAPGAGDVAVRAVARVRGRTATVGRRVRRARGAGRLTVTLKASAAARRAVRAHRRLRATVKVAFSPRGGGAAVRVRRPVVLRATGTGRPSR
jgi:hypothetical protein